MPVSISEGKNSKLKLIPAGILFVIALFVVYKTFFSSSSQSPADSASVQPLDIANAENIKINQINPDLFSSQKFKDFQEYPVKITEIKDIKKGNENPFAEKNINKKIELNNAAIDKLFAEFTSALGVELNGEEKAKCLEELTRENVTSDKYYEPVRLCFVNKRNKILGQ